MVQCLSKFIKLAEIAVTVVLDSVEDERTFSTLGFVKSKLCNHLGSHLDTTVKLFLQPFNKQETFPYNSAIVQWREQKA
jgi:hypothetical protein